MHGIIRKQLAEMNNYKKKSYVKQEESVELF